jgi:hypothetical protein
MSLSWQESLADVIEKVLTAQCVRNPNFYNENSEESVVELCKEAVHWLYSFEDDEDA